MNAHALPIELYRARFGAHIQGHHHGLVAAPAHESKNVRIVVVDVNLLAASERTLRFPQAQQQLVAVQY